MHRDWVEFVHFDKHTKTGGPWDDTAEFIEPQDPHRTLVASVFKICKQDIQHYVCIVDVMTYGYASEAGRPSFLALTV